MNSRYNDIPRIMLAAPGSGSGKTILTCALMEVLKRRRLRVQGFKCGPDYIDPMFHQRVLGIPSVNLDTWFTGRAGTIRLFEQHTEAWQDGRGSIENPGSGADIAVIEGVMGLYDGLGGITETASSYELASFLTAPIILIVDARGKGRSVIAEIKGFQSMDRNQLIAGIILNKTSRSFADLLKPEIEKACGVSLVGSFPYAKELRIDSRHLGLKLPQEINALQEEIGKAADILQKNADIDMILKISGLNTSAEHCHNQEIETNAAIAAWPCLSGNRKNNRSGTGKPATEKESRQSKRVRIAVAQDEAFCFYYEDNLRILKSLGAEIVPFSPIHDRHLPDHINGIYLGGGYPELKARELSSNLSMRKEIAEAVRNGMPSVAECGGFMYLHQEMETPEGKACFPMIGVVPGSCRYTGKLVRFGYCSVTEHHPIFLQEGQEIRGHEFHYYDSDANGSDCTATKPVSGKSWECVYETDRSFWGYPHLYWPSAPQFAEHFVECCRR